MALTGRKKTNRVTSPQKRSTYRVSVQPRQSSLCFALKQFRAQVVMLQHSMLHACPCFATHNAVITVICSRANFQLCGTARMWHNNELRLLHVVSIDVVSLGSNRVSSRPRRLRMTSPELGSIPRCSESHSNITFASNDWRQNGSNIQCICRKMFAQRMISKQKHQQTIDHHRRSSSSEFLFREDDRSGQACSWLSSEYVSNAGSSLACLNR